jgi:hypothetical protein
VIGILSIDFDYFIDASSEERDIYFPDGSDEMPKDKLKSIWKESYLKYPKLKEIGVTDDFYFIKNFLMSFRIRKSNFYKSDTHKNIKLLLDKIPKSTELRLVNIDFHHDYYHYYKDGDNYNCGNWLRRLMEERPRTKVKWIRRKDSQICSLEGDFPYEHTTDIKTVLSDTFQYIFICESPEWSPPHLNYKFEELAGAIVYC